MHPVPFYAIRYINDKRYLPGDDSMATRRLRPSEEDVKLRATAVKSGEDYRQQHVLHVVTLKKIGVLENLALE